MLKRHMVDSIGRFFLFKLLGMEFQMVRTVEDISKPLRGFFFWGGGSQRGNKKGKTIVYAFNSAKLEMLDLRKRGNKT